MLVPEKRKPRPDSDEEEPESNKIHQNDRSQERNANMDEDIVAPDEETYNIYN